MESSISINEVYQELRSLGGRFDEGIKEVKAVAERLERDVRDLRMEMLQLSDNQHSQKEDIVKLEERTGGLEAKVLALEEQIDKAEQYSRRDNLLFHGLKERPDEDCTVTILNLLQEDVRGRRWEDRDFVRVHRLGRRGTRNQPRPIIAKFHHHQDKMSVLENRETLKRHGVGVSNDLTARQRRTLKGLKEEGKTAYYKGGRLVIEEPAPTRPPRLRSSPSNRPSTPPSVHARSLPPARPRSPPTARPRRSPSTSLSTPTNNRASTPPSQSRTEWPTLSSTPSTQRGYPTVTAPTTERRGGVMTRSTSQSGQSRGRNSSTTH